MAKKPKFDNDADDKKGGKKAPPFGKKGAMPFGKKAPPFGKKK